jgi:hypothetical protein
MGLINKFLGLHQQSRIALWSAQTIIGAGLGFAILKVANVQQGAFND